MSTQIGQQAETIATQWLESRGYQVLERNWRTKLCEIDIICQKDRRLHFVEVKYRRQPISGSGLEYITAKKLKQMSFAADMWLASHSEVNDYELSAISLSGHPPQVEEFIPELT